VCCEATVHHHNTRTDQEDLSQFVQKGTRNISRGQYSQYSLHIQYRSFSSFFLIDWDLGESFDCFIPIPKSCFCQYLEHIQSVSKHDWDHIFPGPKVLRQYERGLVVQKVSTNSWTFSSPPPPRFSLVMSKACFRASRALS
jgi:hypothetical protein